MTVFFALSTYCLVPNAGWAANVGFVPSTGLWFSPTTFSAGDSINVYTVVINNDYYALDGIVTFYDNNQSFDTAVVTQLLKEQAKQVKVTWKPTAGEHNLSARFTKAVAVDAKGSKQEISLSQINNVTGAPLEVGGSSVAPVTPVTETQTIGESKVVVAASGVTPSDASVAIGSTAVAVVQQGKTLVLKAAEILKTQSVQQTDANPTSQNSNSTSTTSVHAASTAVDPFAKNKEIIDKASNLAATITSTAGKINEAYAAGKGAVETGQSFYKQAQDTWSRIDPYWQKMKPYWLSISHNNDPKQIAIIAGVVIVGYWILKFMFRRRRRRWED